MNGRYAIKCDDCKAEIGRTDELHESAAGGRCVRCWPRAERAPARLVKVEPVTHPRWDYRVTVIQCGRERHGFVSGGAQTVDAMVRRFTDELDAFGR